MIEKTTSVIFPDIENRINKLIRITDKYLFDDLVKAIFCINICINNRSMLESSVALNGCLIEHKNKGTKEIKNYNEFSQFFNEIYEICKPTYSDDYTIEDFGEVRINFNDSFYRVILGTGHNNVYACISFLTCLARITNREKELTSILEYSSSIIEYFMEDNKNDGVENTRFILPSYELFNKTKRFFDEEISKSDIKYLSGLLGETNLIEKKHFITKKDEVYPVFNTSMLVDTYDLWESKLSDKERTTLANNGILDKIFNIFELDRSINCDMYAPSKLVIDGKPSENTPIYTFVAKGSRGLIIALNVDEYANEMLEEELKRIKRLHKENRLEIVEAYDRFSTGQLRGLSIKEYQPIVFLLYNSFSNISRMNINLNITTEKHIFTALDIIYYLCFTDNIDELFEYLIFRQNNDFDQILGFGSDAALFFTWKNQERYISKGAIKFNILDVGYDTENIYVVDYFKNELKMYPFSSVDYMFQEPFVWKIAEIDSDSFEIYAKYGSGFGGRVIPLNEHGYIFQANNVEFYKDNEDIEQYRNIIQVLDEIIVEGVSSIKDIFSIEKKYGYRIQLLFLPIHYAKNINPTSFFTESRVYCYSDALFDNGKWIIKFVVKDLVKIFTDLELANDRSIEFKILEEIFSPMLDRVPHLKDAFLSKIRSLSECPKRIGILSGELDYIRNDYYVDYFPEAYHFHEIRKRISILCNNNSILPGVYKGKDANKVIRSMQKSLIKDFEKEVSKISGMALHLILLDYYSLLLHKIYVNKLRYGSNQSIDQNKDERIRENIINQREESKQEVREVLYVIETNLYINKESKKNIEKDSFLLLLAYANWLIVLNDVADMCHFTESEAYIEINEDFTIDTMPSNKNENSHQLLKRIYDYSSGLSRDNQIDIEFVSNFKSSFEKDTGLNFEILHDLLIYLRVGFDEKIVKRIGRNVYSVDRSILINHFINTIDSNIEFNELNRYLSFLEINEQNLKTINNKTDFYLPIGNKNDRENRFDIKPIYCNGDEVIFSPITIDYVNKEWINGIFDFILPYRSNLSNTVKTIYGWKKEYERKIVFDLEKVFLDEDFELVKTNFELKKISRQHPQELGDYDIFAIDGKNKSVRIIECKVIMKVSTFFDMFTQQRRFFHEQKEDEKFQKRIDYLKKNLSTVINQLGYSNQEEYKVKSFMCVNKVFGPRYKNVSFPIVSYAEMVDIIKNYNIDNELDI